MVPLLLLPLTLVPSARADTFVVDDTADSSDSSTADGICDAWVGGCTLRAAIGQAGATPGPDTIEVPAGEFMLFGVYRTSSDIEIVGAGQGQTVLLPMYTRAFQVDGGTLTLADLTIRGGLADRGAAIYIPGDTDAPTLVATDVDIEDCTATLEGGGLYLGADGQPTTPKTSYATLERVRFIGNSAADGGAVHADGLRARDGLLTMVDCELTGNSAVRGAALRIDGFPVARIEGGLVAWNEAWYAGGAMLVADGQANVSDLTILGNNGQSIVEVDGPSTGWGSLELRRSFVRDNEATGCVVLGGISGTAEVSSTIVGRNTAGDGGGAVCGGVHLVASAVVGNTIRGDGAGYRVDQYLDHGWSILNSTIALNRAHGSGGGVWLSPYGSSPPWGEGIKHTTIVLNVADADGDGVGTGGGLSSARVLPVENTLVAGNTYGARRTPGDCLSLVTSTGVNLFRVADPATCVGLGADDLAGTAVAPLDPMLEPGRLLGATWWGYVPRAGSPVVDKATLGATIDQRSVARPVDGDGDGVALPDIGSIERVP